MTAAPLPRIGNSQNHLQSWAVSLLLHGFAIGSAIALLSDLRLAPQPEPFRWIVSQRNSPMQAVSPALAPSSQARPETQVIEPRPIATKPTSNQAEPAPVPHRERQTEFVSQPAEPSPPLPHAAQSSEASPRRDPAQAESGALPQTMQATAAASVTAAASQPVVETPPHHEETTLSAHRELAESVKASASDPTVRQEPAAVASLAPPSQMELSPPAGQAARPKADYGWLGQTLRTRVEQLKHYPHLARANRWEGRVVLRAMIGEEGQLMDVTVAESSGHTILDDAALEVVKKAAPLTLPQPLGRAHVVVQIPITYRLR